MRADRLSRILEPLLDRGSLFFELRDRAPGIALQRLLARNVCRQRSIEPIELGEAPRDRVPARPSRGELMGKFVPLLAKLSSSALRRSASAALARSCAA